MMRYFVFCFFFLLLGACTKQSSKPHVIQQGEFSKAKHLLTKHFDIPVPNSFILEKTSSTQTGPIVRDYQRYSGSTPIKQTYVFYKSELEKNGWEINDLSLADQVFLYCTKHNKQCGIQLHKNNEPINSTELCIFVNQKADRDSFI